MIPEQYLPQRRWAGWLVSLILTGLILVACGGTSESVSQQPTSPADTGAATNAAPVVEEKATVEEVAAEETTPAEAATEAVAPAQAATPEEAAPAGAAEAAQDENPSLPGVAAEVTCQTADPAQDPIAALANAPDNELIAAVSDSDWARGPVEAPVTLIEYGDFQ